jgi:alpha-glucosidase
VRTTSTSQAGSWWNDAVIYEVYLPSFADGNGDGIGDLYGVLRRLDYLADLGVDALWLTPFYPSPGKDHGYDVADYRSVASHLGDLGVVRQIVDGAHERSMRVITDQIPNHTSAEHPWFQAALAEPQGPYRDYYVWRDPAPDGGPPNNWISTFGGRAWTLDPASGQYYLHLYLPEQPDLNWRNPRVYAEWLDILRFWLDVGVDGFRIDVAHTLLKHPDLPDNPPADPGARPSVLSRVAEARTLRRLYDVDQDDVLDVYRRLRADLPPTSRGEEPLLLGETVLDDARRLQRYLAGEGLHSAMWFGAMLVPWTAEHIRAALQGPRHAGGGWPAWFLANHDRPRPASRLCPARPRPRR